MIHRRGFVSGLGAALLAPFAAEAQQARDTARIGFLSVRGVATAAPPLVDAFRQGLDSLGYVESRTIKIEYRDAQGDPTRLSALAQELAEARVDVIVAAGTQAIQAAKRATTTIPIVMAISSDPVGSGLVASLRRPGGNVTGLTHLNPEVGGKRLELLREAAPTASRVGVLWNARHPAKRAELRETEAAATKLGVRLLSVSVAEPHGFDGAFAKILEERPQALLTLEDSLTLAHRQQIAAFALKQRLPSMFEPREFVEAGGLMAYGPVFADLYRRAAVYVHKILNGAKPGELPVEQPTKFELAINLRTAKALGVTIPPSLLLRADRVID